MSDWFDYYKKTGDRIALYYGLMNVEHLEPQYLDDIKDSLYENNYKTRIMISNVRNTRT